MHSLCTVCVCVCVCLELGLIPGWWGGVASFCKCLWMASYDVCCLCVIDLYMFLFFLSPLNDHNDPDRLSWFWGCCWIEFGVRTGKRKDAVLRYAQETCGSWRNDGFLITRMNAPWLIWWRRHIRTLESASNWYTSCWYNNAISKKWHPQKNHHGRNRW